MNDRLLSFYFINFLNFFKILINEGLFVIFFKPIRLSCSKLIPSKRQIEQIVIYKILQTLIIFPMV